MSDVLSQVSALFDSYSRAARLMPGLLLLLGPVAVGIGAGAESWPAATALTGAAAAMGLPLVLTDWIRRRGQRLQSRLWHEWGGNPVVAALRGEGAIVRRRRAALAEATGLPVVDPSHPNFDEAVGNAIRRLISATRDKAEYPLIFAENKAYGFARNLLAIRDVGVLVSAVALVLGLAAFTISFELAALSTAGTSLGVLSAAAALAISVWYPSEDRVRAAADDYRDRLLEALDAEALGPQPGAEAANNEHSTAQPR